MLIVKGGFTSSDWTSEIECTSARDAGCGATLRVGLADLFTKHVHDIGDTMIWVIAGREKAQKLRTDAAAKYKNNSSRW